MEKELNIKISLSRPYKCCDLKPIYGLLFNRYVKECDFWGYCDLIFGNIRKFVTDDILNENDKIYISGHLSLYRNNNKINNLFKSSVYKVGNYIDVFQDEKTGDMMSGIKGNQEI